MKLVALILTTALSSLTANAADEVTLPSDMSLAIVKYLVGQPSIAVRGHQGPGYYIAEVECGVANGFGEIDTCYARESTGFTQTIQAPVKMDLVALSPEYHDFTPDFIQLLTTNYGDSNLLAIGYSGWDVKLVCEFSAPDDRPTKISQQKCTISPIQ